jgi:hypothetical protein
MQPLCENGKERHAAAYHQDTNGPIPKIIMGKYGIPRRHDRTPPCIDDGESKPKLCAVDPTEEAKE